MENIISSSDEDRRRNSIIVMWVNNNLIQKNKGFLRKILNSNKDQEKIWDDMIDLNDNDRANKINHNIDNINEEWWDNIMDL
jgi:hypothetical protein